MAQVAGLVFRAGVVCAFGGVDVVEALVHLGVEAHVVEDEEFRFGPEIDRVAHAGGLHIFLRGLGDRARATSIVLPRCGLDDVAHERQGGLCEERIDERRIAVGHKRHVGFVDRLPARDRRTVEHRAVCEEILVHQRKVEGDVLPLAARIGETEIDELDLFVLDELQDGVCV
jgi:hypothetical protein